MDRNLNKKLMEKVNEIIDEVKEDVVEGVPTIISIDPEDLIHPDNLHKDSLIAHIKKFHNQRDLYLTLHKSLTHYLFEKGIIFKDNLQQLDHINEIVMDQMRKMSERDNG